MTMRNAKLSIFELINQGELEDTKRHKNRNYET